MQGVFAGQFTMILPDLILSRLYNEVDLPLLNVNIQIGLSFAVVCAIVKIDIEINSIALK